LSFLATSNPAASQRVVTDLSRAIQSLQTLADRGRPSAVSGARELIVPFGRSAYILRYVHDVLRGEVIILRIWHGREARG
jgi:plasmid stabilization system protein ParE